MQTLHRSIKAGNGDNWQMCYSAKRDGYSSYKFHELCDNKGPLFFQAYVLAMVSGSLA